jgi:DNA-binding CsgD family transcriptional regulator
MAAKRQISPATLKNHIHSILAKTGFRTLPDLIADLLREHGGLRKIDLA